MYSEKTWLEISSYMEEANDIYEYSEYPDEYKAEAARRLMGLIGDFDNIKDDVNTRNDMLYHLFDIVVSLDWDRFSYVAPEVFEEFREAVEVTRAVLNNANASSEEVEAAATQLIKALNSVYDV